jgi:hemoglobin
MKMNEYSYLGAMQKHDILLEEDVKALVNAFYDKVRADDVIGYIFNDIAHVNWEHHLPRMYAFWEFLLLGKDTYKGNPIEPHHKLAMKVDLKVEHFDRWLKLFQESVDDLFIGPGADNAKNRAYLITETWKPKFTGPFK